MRDTRSSLGFDPPVVAFHHRVASRHSALHGAATRSFEDYVRGALSDRTGKEAEREETFKRGSSPAVFKSQEGWPGR